MSLMRWDRNILVVWSILQRRNRQGRTQGLGQRRVSERRPVRVGIFG